MRALILLRHSLTEGNARRLYCGWTDLPLSAEGRALALEMRESRPLPPFEIAVTSGLRRADETLLLLTGRSADAVLPDLREMHFGAFEMHSYEELKNDPDYIRWIEGAAGCPGGETRDAFDARVRRGGEALLAMAWGSALAVVHGGVIANLMARWFPCEDRHFYQWQPEPCRGYAVRFDKSAPADFEEV